MGQLSRRTVECFSQFGESELPWLSRTLCEDRGDERPIVAPNFGGLLVPVARLPHDVSHQLVVSRRAGDADSEHPYIVTRFGGAKSVSGSAFSGGRWEAGGSELVPHNVIAQEVAQVVASTVDRRCVQLTFTRIADRDTKPAVSCHDAKQH